MTARNLGGIIASMRTFLIWSAVAIAAVLTALAGAGLALFLA